MFSILAPSLPMTLIQLATLCLVFSVKSRTKFHPLALAGGWIACWAFAGWCGLAAWRMHQDWLHFIRLNLLLPSYEREIGSFQATHSQTLWQMGLSGTFFVLLPLAWYWGDRRRRRAAAQAT